MKSAENAMEDAQSSGRTLKRRLLEGDRLAGVFVKTPSHQSIEILATSGLDFIVLDAEHAPFDRADLDRCIMTARLSRLPVIVRVPSCTPEWTLSVLDMGADGLMAPHIASGEAARKLVAASKYEGSRGFSASHRAAGYGRSDFAAYRREADSDTILICQIEDPEALGKLDSILSLTGVDCAFIGRADLMAALGAENLKDARVERAVQEIIDAAKKHGRPVGVFVSSADEIGSYASAGASFFVVGSDQSLLKNSAKALANKAKGQSPI